MAAAVRGNQPRRDPGRRHRTARGGDGAVLGGRGGSLHARRSSVLAPSSLRTPVDPPPSGRRSGRDNTALYYTPVQATCKTTPTTHKMRYLSCHRTTGAISHTNCALSSEAHRRTKKIQLKQKHHALLSLQIQIARLTLWPWQPWRGCASASRCSRPHGTSGTAASPTSAESSGGRPLPGCAA